MVDVILTQGLPRSGKTTWANAWKSEDPTNRVVICQDDIGMRLAKVTNKADIPRSSAFYQDVAAKRDRLIRDALVAGKSVCVADTNLMKSKIKQIKTVCDTTEIPYTFIINSEFCRVPLVEILARNEKSGSEAVPETVIFRMYEDADAVDFKALHKIPQDKHKPAIAVFDIDGTLALKAPERNIYDGTLVRLDSPNKWVCNICDMYETEGIEVHLVSGRTATAICRAETERWLGDMYDAGHLPVIPKNRLHMRQEGDTRPDWQVKEDILRQLLTNYKIEVWVDDRNSVVTHIRSLGVNVLQCNFGRV